MSKRKNQWLIKKVTGHIDGPLSTSEVMEKIRVNELRGDEQIALFPGTKWVPITYEQDFYDVMMGVLEEGDSYQPPPQYSDEDATVFDFDLNEVTEKKINPSSVKGSEKQKRVSQEKPSVAKEIKIKKQIKMEPEPEVLDLKPIKDEIKKQKLKRLLLPIVCLGVVLAALYSYISKEESSTVMKTVELIAPKINQKQAIKKIAANDAINKKTKKAIAFYHVDSFLGYNRAQNSLVKILESNRNEATAWQYLCLSYLELWPYTKQSSEDLKVLSYAVAESRKVGFSGAEASSCKVVESLIKGKYSSAKAIVDSVLASYSQSAKPPIPYYYFKAILLSSELDYRGSLGYITSVQKLSPSWLKTYLFEASLRLKIGEKNLAAKRLKQVLQASPDHTKALLDLAVIEYNGFRNYDEAESLFKKGIAAKDRVSTNTLFKAYISLSEIQIYKKNNAEALKWSRLAYKINPNSALAKNLLSRLGGEAKDLQEGTEGYHLVVEGDLFAQEGNCKAAQAHYKAAYEINPSNSMAALKAANCMWKLHFSSESIEWLNKAIASDSKLLDAHLYLSDYYSQMYDYGAAFQALNRAAPIFGASFEIYRAFGLVEKRRNNFKAALEYFKKAQNLNEFDTQIQIDLTETLLALGKQSEAYTMASAAKDSNSHDVDVLVNYGKAMQFVDGFEAAIGYFKNLIKTFPSIASYRLALGDVLLEDERYVSAAKSYRRALQVDENSQEALYGLGKSLHAQGLFEGALESYVEASLLAPSDPRPLHKIGNLYREMGQLNKAVESFERLARQNSKFPLVKFEIGKTLLLKGQAKKALSWAQQEVRANPSLAQGYMLLGEIYEELRQYPKCSEQYQKAIQFSPKGAIIYVRMGRCYRKQGLVDIAETMLKRAEKLESGRGDIYKEFGYIYEKKSDNVSARAAFEKYLSLNPGAKDYSIIKGKINAL